jgi:hypothetical protein
MNRRLLVVTDLGLLKAYELTETSRGTPHLDRIEELMLDEVHHRLTERITDLAGRRAAPTQKKWGAPMADDHNLRLETKRRVIRQIVGRLEELLQKRDYEACWLAADGEINRQVLEQLPGGLRRRIEKNIPLDLIKASKEELLKRFVPAPVVG